MRKLILLISFFAAFAANVSAEEEMEMDESSLVTGDSLNEEDLVLKLRGLGDVDEESLEVDVEDLFVTLKKSLHPPSH